MCGTTTWWVHAPGGASVRSPPPLCVPRRPIKYTYDCVRVSTRSVQVYFRYYKRSGARARSDGRSGGAPARLACQGALKSAGRAARDHKGAAQTLPGHEGAPQSPKSARISIWGAVCPQNERGGAHDAARERTHTPAAGLRPLLPPKAHARAARLTVRPAATEAAQEALVDLWGRCSPRGCCWYRPRLAEAGQDSAARYTRRHIRTKSAASSWARKARLPPRTS